MEMDSIAKPAADVNDGTRQGICDREQMWRPTSKSDYHKYTQNPVRRLPYLLKPTSKHVLSQGHVKQV
jgi:hypothetical protein